VLCLVELTAPLTDMLTVENACYQLWFGLSIIYFNRSQVQGSTFRVKDIEGIKDPKYLIKMLIFPNKIKCQLLGILNIGHCDLFGMCDLLFEIFNC